MHANIYVISPDKTFTANTDEMYTEALMDYVGDESLYFDEDVKYIQDHPEVYPFIITKEGEDYVIKVDESKYDSWIHDIKAAVHRELDSNEQASMLRYRCENILKRGINDSDSLFYFEDNCVYTLVDAVCAMHDYWSNTTLYLVQSFDYHF